MKLEVGDQVKFLNTTGGGVVTKVLDSRMVLVADQHGFEIPTLIAELIRIDPTDAGSRFFKEEYEIPDAIRKNLEADEDFSGNTGHPEEEKELLEPHVIRSRKAEEIFLGYLPHDQQWLITGMVDVFLINNTSFDLIYNFFHHPAPGKYIGMDYGSLFANSRHLVATVDREYLAPWTEGSMQFLFHKDFLESVIPPFDMDFQIDGKKFHKEGAYRETPLLTGKGILIRLLSLTSYMEEFKATTSLHTHSDGDKPEVAMPAESPLIFSHQTEPRKAEVDLHIHELVEDTSNLQKTEILDFQKNYFIRCLDSAIANNFLNVTFIHGIGDGVLRNALIEQLKKTEGIEWFDAPMAKYGAGAIEVRIPHNR